MKHSLKLLSVVLLFTAGAWCQRSATGNITAQGTTCNTSNACVALNLDAASGGATITLSGTFSGTLQFEASGDGGTSWVAINGTALNGTTGVTSATAPGSWQMNVSGLTGIRVRCSAYTSGTIVATIQSATSSARGAGSGASSVNASTYTLLPFYSSPGINNVLTGATGLSVDSTTQSIFNASGGMSTGISQLQSCAASGVIGCFSFAEAGSANQGTPTAGECMFQTDLTTNKILSSCNGGTLTALGGGATLQTNSVSNTSQSALNLLNSNATNGLTLTFSNTSAGNVQLGLSGTLSNTGLTNSTITILGHSTPLGTSAAIVSSDIVGLFTGCTGSLLLGADGACHAGTGSGLGDPGSNSVVYRNALNTTAAATAQNIGTPLRCSDTSGSATAQVCNTSPTFTPAAGDAIIYTTTTANTGALTLNVNSQGVKGVKKYQNTALVANDILAGKQTFMTYDGTNWELQDIGNPPVGSGTVTTTGTPTSGMLPVLSGTTSITSTPTGGRVMKGDATNGGIIFQDNVVTESTIPLVIDYTNQDSSAGGVASVMSVNESQTTSVDNAAGLQWHEINIEMYHYGHAAATVSPIYLELHDDISATGSGADGHILGIVSRAYCNPSNGRTISLCTPLYLTGTNETDSVHQLTGAGTVSALIGADIIMTPFLTPANSTTLAVTSLTGVSVAFPSSMPSGVSVTNTSGILIGDIAGVALGSGTNCAIEIGTSGGNCGKSAAINIEGTPVVGLWISTVGGGQGQIISGYNFGTSSGTETAFQLGSQIAGTRNVAATTGIWRSIDVEHWARNAGTGTVNEYDGIYNKMTTTSGTAEVYTSVYMFYADPITTVNNSTGTVYDFYARNTDNGTQTQFNGFYCPTIKNGTGTFTNTPICFNNSDSLAKNIVAGSLRTGTSSNNDEAGTVTLSSGSGTYTLLQTYAVAPICVASDTTAANAVKVVTSTTTVTFTGTGTDVVAYQCWGRT